MSKYVGHIFWTFKPVCYQGFKDVAFSVDSYTKNPDIHSFVNTRILFWQYRSG